MFRMLRLKPPNGWNAVAWELGIVVVGVLLALIAQEWANERSLAGKVRQSRTALRSELADHYAWAVEWRVVSPCVLRQIAVLQERVARSGPRLEPAPVFIENERHYVLRSPSKEYPTSAWSAVQNDGLSGRFDPALRTELSHYYVQVGLIAEHVERNGIDYRRLLTLGRPISLDPMVRYSIMQTLDELRGRVEFVDLLSGQLIDRIVRVGMVPPAAGVRGQVERFGTFKFCTRYRLPLRSMESAMVPVAN